MKQEALSLELLALLDWTGQSGQVGTGLERSGWMGRTRQKGLDWTGLDRTWLDGLDWTNWNGRTGQVRSSGAEASFENGRMGYCGAGVRRFTGFRPYSPDLWSR